MDEEEGPSRPGGSGGGRGPHRRPSPMTAATLRDLKRDDPATILTRLSRPNSGLIEFIKRSDLGADAIKLLVEVLGKACLCESMQECLNTLLVEIQMTNFIDTTLSQLLLQACMRKNGDDEILKSVLPFFNTLLEKMPTEETTKVHELDFLLEKLWKKGEMKNEDINQGMAELRELLVRSQPPPPQAAQAEAEEISSNEPTDPSDDSDTSDSGGGAAPSVLIQHGVRNEATISPPITGITQVGRENIINVHTETETFKIKVRPKHKDVEAVVAINMVVPDEDMNPNRTLVLGQDTTQGEVNAGEEIFICIESDALTKRQERSRNRNTIGCGLRSTTVTFIRALFRRVNMIVNNLRNGSIVIGLQPKTDSAVFDLINAVDEGIIKELVCRIFENEPGLITEEESGEQIKLKIDINIPNRKFPKAFPCKQFESRKDLLQELTDSVQREVHGQKDKGPIESSFPTCQICHQQFSHRGPAPFLLPCLHSVCETCVTSADGGVINCGPCERDVDLTETPLQKDEVREKQILHLTVQHHPELVLCTYEEDGNQAVFWCNECDGFLCENCQMVHSSSKATRKHLVQDVGEMDPGKLDDEQYCSEHPKYIADIWDKDCCMLTCIKCTRDEHAKHECVDVEETDMIAKSEIVKLGKEVQVTADQHAGHLQGAEKDLQSADETSKHLANEISIHSNALRVVIDQRQGKLEIDLKNNMETIRAKLAEIKTRSETCHQRCQTTSDYINNTLRYSSRHNIRELKPLFEEKFKDCKSSAPSEDYTSIPLPVFNTGGLKKATLTVALFGTIEMAKTATENQIKDSGTQTEDDVVQELGRLTQVMEKLTSSRDQLIKEKEQIDEEVDKLRQDIKQLEISQGHLFVEREKMKQEHEEAVKKFKREVNQLKRYQDQQLKEEEKIKKESWKEAEELRQQVSQLIKSQDHLTKEKDKIKKESEEATEKFKQEVTQLKMSHDEQLREEEKMKKESWKEAEKLRQEVNQLKMTHDRQLKDEEKMKKDSWKESERLKQEVDKLNKEKERMKKESMEAAKKLEQESKKSNAYRGKITDLEQKLQKGWHELRTQALDESFLLKCTDIKFSMTKYNAEKVHINTDGNLINKPQPNPPHSDQRLKKYTGTNSTVPLPQCGSPQYFEVESQVGIEKTLTGNTLLLQIGLARKEEQDQHHSITGQPHSYSLAVSHCTTHSSICRDVWRHGTPLTCLSDTLENTPGTTATLHYGVVYDGARSRIAFLDVKNEKIIGKIDNVDSSVALWPMFGVYNPYWATVSMSLVVGGDINMTDKKKGLILDCLS